MTRAEFIQRVLIQGLPLDQSIHRADALEESDAAPWDEGRDLCGGSEHCPGCAGCIPSLRGREAKFPLENNRAMREQIAAEEREACAQIADDVARLAQMRRSARQEDFGAVAAASNIAQAIRARDTTVAK